MVASCLNSSFKARFSSCYARDTYKKGKAAKFRKALIAMQKFTGMHNAQDYLPVRKIGKPLLTFKARLSIAISIWLLLLGDLKIPFAKECFLITS